MYTLQGWVATPENRTALAAVQRVLTSSTRRHREINPLFLHGAPGTGKTHLASALAAEVTEQCPHLTVTVVSARTWAEHNPEVPTEADRDSDLLVVEDLQNLPARAADAFGSMLDRRIARQQQTVLTATRGPADLESLPARIVGRCAAGLVVGIAPFGPASRLAFLRDRCNHRGLTLPDDVLAWLAKHVGASGRQLEGGLARVETLTRALGKPPTLEEITAQLQAENEAVRPSVEKIVERVGRFFKVEPRTMKSASRLRHALLPRQVSMYLARQLTPLSLDQIGAYFGGRDHSTVLHACRKVEEAMSRDAALSGVVRQLRSEFQ